MLKIFISSDYIYIYIVPTRYLDVNLLGHVIIQEDRRYIVFNTCVKKSGQIQPHSKQLRLGSVC